MQSNASYELEVNNSSDISHIEMNFQNQESRPSEYLTEKQPENSKIITEDDINQQSQAV